jgi:hypothetical protein
MKSVRASEEVDLLMVTGSLAEQRGVIVQRLASTSNPEKLADLIIAADEALGEFAGFHAPKSDFSGFVSRNLRLLVEEIGRFARLHRSAMKPNDLLTVQEFFGVEAEILSAL